MSIKEKASSILKRSDYSDFQLELENLLDIPSGIDNIISYTDKARSVAQQAGRAKTEEKASNEILGFIEKDLGLDWRELVGDREFSGGLEAVLQEEGVPESAFEGSYEAAIGKAAERGFDSIFKIIKYAAEGGATETVNGQVVPLQRGKLHKELMQSLDAVLSEIPIFGAIAKGGMALFSELAEATRREGIQRFGADDYIKEERYCDLYETARIGDHKKLYKTADDYYEFAWNICPIWPEPPENVAADRLQPNWRYSEPERSIARDKYWMGKADRRKVAGKVIDTNTVMYGVRVEDVPLWMPIRDDDERVELFITGYRLGLEDIDDWLELSLENPMKGIEPVGTPFEQLTDAQKADYLQAAEIVVAARHSIPGMSERDARAKGKRVEDVIEKKYAAEPQLREIKTAGVEQALARLKHGKSRRELEEEYARTGGARGGGGGGGGILLGLAALGLGYLAYRKISGGKK